MTSIFSFLFDTSLRTVSKPLLKTVVGNDNKRSRA
nr:MAG TPA: hypothetical protein [Caudoviricetes sp.]